MTEHEWLGSTNPGPMLRYLTYEKEWPRAHPLVSDRQLRLFACSCARRVWPHLVENRSRHAVVVAEQFADGLASAISLEAACAAASAAASAADSAAAWAAAWAAGWAAAWAAGWAADCAAHMAAPRAAGWAADCAAHMAAHRAAGWAAPRAAGWAAPRAAGCAADRAVQADILRDIIGNPFRPRPVFSADWRTSLVLSVGTAIYQDRDDTGELDPVGLLMLSDALEEAGCTGEVLDHLRSPGPHVRGCWALDLVLGKE